MQLISIVIPSLLCAILAGCERPGIRGNGIMGEEGREIQEFNALEIGGSFTVEAIPGETVSLEIKGEENLLPYIRTRNKNSKLIIDTTENISPTETLHIKVSFKNLKGIKAAGANSVYISDIDHESFNVDSSGAGSIVLEGRTQKLRISLSGAGTIDARHFLAEEVDVAVSGVGSVSVYASESLDARISGVGTIQHFGEPKKVKSDVAGVGSIRAGKS